MYSFLFKLPLSVYKSTSSTRLIEDLRGAIKVRCAPDVYDGTSSVGLTDSRSAKITK